MVILALLIWSIMLGNIQITDSFDSEFNFVGELKGGKACGRGIVSFIEETEDETTYEGTFYDNM